MGEISETSERTAFVNPLETLLGYHLRRASIAMMADLAQRLSTLDLTLTEVSILQVIDVNPQINQSEIGRLLSIKRANMAPTVAGMLSRRLIRKEAMDGRSHGLTLGPEGGAVLAEARRLMEDNESLFVSRIPKAQRGALISTLRALWTKS